MLAPPSLLLARAHLVFTRNSNHENTDRSCWPLAVGRWPLAVGLSALCGLNVPQARAGEWRAEPLPPAPAQGAPGYDAWKTAAAALYPGDFIVKQSSPEKVGWNYKPYPAPANVAAPVQKFPLTLNYAGSPPIPTNGAAWSGAAKDAMPLGGSGEVSYSGTIKMKLRYYPSTIQNANGATVPDPNDKPYAPFYLKIVVTPYLEAYDDRPGINTPNNSAENISSSVTPQGDTLPNAGAVAAITIAPGEIQDSGWGKSYLKDLTFYVPVYPNGNTTKTVSVFSIVLKAWLTTGRKTLVSPSYEWNGGKARAAFWFTGQPADYADPLYISSDIEKSFSKSVGALSGAYKQRDSSGRLRYESQQVAGQNTPADTSDDVWRVECIRGSNGSMTVESAARWWAAAPSVTTTGGGASGWYGSAKFYATQSGYTAPLFTWTLPDGSVGATISPSASNIVSIVDLTFANNGPVAVNRGISLGGNKAGVGMTPSTTTSVQVVEQTPSLPSMPLSASYNVRWHLPADNWQNNSSLDEQLTPHQEPLAATKVDANTSFDFYNLGAGQPNAPDVHEFDWGLAASTTGTLLGAGDAAYLIATGAALQPEVGALLMLGSAGISVLGNFVPPPNEPERRPYSVTGATGYAAYKQAVMDAGSGVTYPDGTPKFTLATRVGDAMASFKPQMFTDDGDNTNDDNFARFQVTGTGSAWFDRLRKTYNCDTWGKNGYVGPNSGRITYWSSPYYRITFTVNGPNAATSTGPGIPGGGG